MKVLEALLQDYPKQSDGCKGFSSDFTFHSKALGLLSCDVICLLSMEHIVRNKIEEKAEGRILIPFPLPPIPYWWISPLRIVLEKAPGNTDLPTTCVTQGGS